MDCLDPRVIATNTEPAEQSKQNDYHKILGVSNLFREMQNLDAQMINKAFCIFLPRHAETFSNELYSRKAAKMAGKAYEVLSDPELRQRFDHGEDPMDLMAAGSSHTSARGIDTFNGLFMPPRPRAGRMHDTGRWGADTGRAVYGVT